MCGEQKHNWTKERAVQLVAAACLRIMSDTIKAE
jgi:hypothetical protein